MHDLRPRAGKPWTTCSSCIPSGGKISDQTRTERKQEDQTLATAVLQAYIWELLYSLTWDGNLKQESVWRTGSGDRKGGGTEMLKSSSCKADNKVPIINNPCQNVHWASVLHPLEQMNSPRQWKPNFQSKSHLSTLTVACRYSPILL